MRHVVLVAPEIHWNTGNVGRTCLGTGAHLHLIKPLGFSLSDKYVRRAGLDYWPKVKLTVWDSFSDFSTGMFPRSGEVAVFSKKGTLDFRRMPCPQRMFLIFGSETKGLPLSIVNRYPDNVYHIPITGDIRSLNLSTAVAVALYESIRSGPLFHSWGRTKHVRI